MIPKVIHCCWFGDNELPESYKQRMIEWQQFLPEWEIKFWSESNYDFKKSPYASFAYSSNKFAHVSDYARVDIVLNYGGVYIDFDVEFIQSYDQLLKYDAFFGFEDKKRINLGHGFGAVKGFNILKSHLEFYDNMILTNQSHNKLFTNSPSVTSEILKKFEVKLNGETQVIENFIVMTNSILSPKKYLTTEIFITNETLSIHHFDEMWFNETQILFRKHQLRRYQVQKKIFGQRIGYLTFRFSEILINKFR